MKINNLPLKGSAHVLQSGVCYTWSHRCIATQDHTDASEEPTVISDLERVAVIAIQILLSSRL